MSSREQILTWLESVTDPEIPTVSIEEMGILRDVRTGEAGEVTVTITPTYSGCPAMDVIAMQIRMTLLGRGLKTVHIEQSLSPAWTTDWITESGRQKMHAFGIAPPVRKAKDDLALFEEDEVPCPKCASVHTELVSRFGATSCKSMYRCLDCKEPFEHFKCH
ncbi:phenylacetate-CoA oxygenase subunit PaaJ [Taibaiella sp. KBW10]|uniref:1,2-phenylacetyl-CoA epoxidase subunit PaaD n=1 Tax=Taibaiella sp. KBW10 TaxID=2153357 RepID=UPI000F5ABAC3|nr:1,2-phenylacetyl-CoA epoxidase subunit PaaD [Taibaiella sp. KBW10]RQO30947.1 phenylacetate-CoA oxygenase subunit PaaJ [Taibaiella sp. KBW10]